MNDSTFQKTVEFYFSIFYPAALNGVTAVKNVCSNFGRIIAAIAIAEGDVGFLFLDDDYMYFSSIILR